MRVLNLERFVNRVKRIYCEWAVLGSKIVRIVLKADNKFEKNQWAGIALTTANRALNELCSKQVQVYEAIYLHEKPIKNRITCRLFTNITHTVVNNHRPKNYGDVLTVFDDILLS